MEQESSQLNNQKNIKEQDHREFQNLDKEYLLKELMKKYTNKVYLLAYSFVRDKGIAEDISQEVFIKCYRHINTYRGEAAITSWIYKITVNTSKDFLRKQKLLKWRFPLKSEDHHSKIESSEETVLKMDKKEEILSFVFSLPLKYREVLILHYFHELKTLEISETLDVSLNTVKTRLARGRNKLKEKLRSEGGESYV
ncbi:sigma-70 family RNA polymerase sigma factor [Halobacillus rhizosphaerae]|uniref:sigma-70 family RNA polymerase sigma factor n=1 Tax=Halobacillus rhizosphaerae TaxID=3064889 RepID=UPI00398AA894